MSHTESMSAEQQSLLFARLVLQLADLANVMMGRVPSPSTGQTVRDLEAARMFLDQLAMLEHKTRGNLLPEESRLLRDTLLNLRLTFVEAVEQTVAPPRGGDKSSSSPPSSGAAAAAPSFSPSEPGSQERSADSSPTSPGTGTTEHETETRRRFFKKYDA